DDEPIEHPWVTKSVENAQRKVEERNFDIRKNLLQYDDVMNDQRRAIFDQRREVMMADDIAQLAADMRHDVIGEMVAKFVPEKAMAEEWDLHGLHEETLRVLGIDLPYKDWAAEEGIADEEIRDRIIAASDRKMAEKAANFGADLMRRVEKSLVLQTIDQGWRDHLAQLDYLRAGVSLRAYGQKQPLLEYQREAFGLFTEMLGGLRERVTAVLSRIEIRREPPPEDLAPRQPMRMTSGAGAVPAPPPSREPPQALAKKVDPGSRDPNDPSTWGKVSRNEPCPCGSGKKFKHCHGDVAKAEALTA
ncbi:MAG: SEC-C domain-containing protein, partial [Rhodobacteraceae bacterium]|nr:SEC-C domain-containing protein [Paracoccaceae bacterium]